MNDIAKTILAAVCTFFTFLFGEWDGMMKALIIFIVLDYVSGLLVAIVKKKVSSAIGAKGIAKKILMLLIVAVANIIDVCVIGESHVLKTVAIVFYISNECISLLENAGRLDVPIPKKLLDVLEQLKTKEE